MADIDSLHVVYSLAIVQRLVRIDVVLNAPEELFAGFLRRHALEIGVVDLDLLDVLLDDIGIVTYTLHHEHVVFDLHVILQEFLELLAASLGGVGAIQDGHSPVFFV